MIIGGPNTNPTTLLQTIHRSPWLKNPCLFNFPFTYQLYFNSIITSSYSTPKWFHLEQPPRLLDYKYKAKSQFFRLTSRVDQKGQNLRQWMERRLGGIKRLMLSSSLFFWTWFRYLSLYVCDLRGNINATFRLGDLWDGVKYDGRWELNNNLVWSEWPLLLRPNWRCEMYTKANIRSRFWISLLIKILLFFYHRKNLHYIWCSPYIYFVSLLFKSFARSVVWNGYNTEKVK